MAAEEAQVGFEDGISWLPSHVLDEACDIKVQQRHYHRRPAFPAETPPLMRFKYKPRQKVGPNWAIGGPGMQAVFLKSGHRSAGTGVFLPSGVGSNFHSSKKPVSSPVLLPSHVVEALNLNVHALALGFKVPNRKAPCGERGRNDDVCCILTGSQNTSAEIYLPKEWSY